MVIAMYDQIPKDGKKFLILCLIVRCLCMLEANEKKKKQSNSIMSHNYIPNDTHFHIITLK